MICKNCNKHTLSREDESFVSHLLLTREPLLATKYLGEYKEEWQKKRVRDNIGITKELEDLEKKVKKEQYEVLDDKIKKVSLEVLLIEQDYKEADLTLQNEIEETNSYIKLIELDYKEADSIIENKIDAVSTYAELIELDYKEADKILLKEIEEKVISSVYTNTVKLNEDNQDISLYNILNIQDNTTKSSTKINPTIAFPNINTSVEFGTKILDKTVSYNMIFTGGSSGGIDSSVTPQSSFAANFTVSKSSISFTPTLDIIASLNNPKTLTVSNIVTLKKDNAYIETTTYNILASNLLDINNKPIVIKSNSIPENKNYMSESLSKSITINAYTPIYLCKGNTIPENITTKPTNYVEKKQYKSGDLFTTSKTTGSDTYYYWVLIPTSSLVNRWQTVALGSASDVEYEGPKSVSISENGESVMYKLYNTKDVVPLGVGSMTINIS